MKKGIIPFLALLLVISILIAINVFFLPFSSYTRTNSLAITFNNKHPAIYFWLEWRSENSNREKVAVLLHSHGFNVSLSMYPPNETITENLDFKYAFVPSTNALRDDNAKILVSKACGLHIEQEAINESIAPSLAGLFSVTNSSGLSGYFKIVSINFTSTKHSVIDGFLGQNFSGSSMQRYVRHSIMNLRDEVQILASFKTDAGRYYPFLYVTKVNGKKYIFNGFRLDHFYSLLSAWNHEECIKKYVLNVAMWFYDFKGATFSFWHKNGAKFGFTWRDDDISAGLNTMSKQPIFNTTLQNYETLFDFFAKRGYRLMDSVVTKGRNDKYPLSSNLALVNCLKNMSENYGFLIVSHTTGHQDMSEASYDEAKTIFNASYFEILKAGLKPAKVIVLPGSGYNFTDDATGRAARDVGFEAVEWIRTERRWHNMEPYSYNDSLGIWLSYGWGPTQARFVHQGFLENSSTGDVSIPFAFQKNDVDILYGSNIVVNYLSHFVFYDETKEINEVDAFLSYIENRGFIWNPTAEELVRYSGVKQGASFVNGILNLTRYIDGLTVRIAVPKPYYLSYDKSLFSSIMIEEDSFMRYYYLTLYTKGDIVFSLASTVLADVSSVKILKADNIDGVGTIGDDPNTLAENLDLYITWYYQGELVKKLHRIDASMKVILYRNLRAIYSDAEEWQEAVYKGWILKDASGNYIRNVKWSNYYLADIGNIEYQNFVANWIKNNIDKYGFDGVIVDYGLDVGDALTYMTSGTAINPRTGNPYNREEWVNDLIRLVKSIKAIIGPKILLVNGIFSGYKFYEHRETYLKVINKGEIDGILSEGLFYSNEKFWYSEQQWKQSLDLLIWVQDNFLSKCNRTRVYICWQNGRNWLVPADATQEQLIAYVITSCLLGIKCFSQTYVTMHGAMLQSYTKHLLSIELGTPKGDYYIIEGTQVYARDFTKAKVLTNPTFRNFSVDLGGYYYYNGQIVSSVIIKPHTGLILQVAT